MVIHMSQISIFLSYEFIMTSLDLHYIPFGDGRYEMDILNRNFVMFNWSSRPVTVSILIG